MASGGDKSRGSDSEKPPFVFFLSILSRASPARVLAHLGNHSLDDTTVYDDDVILHTCPAGFSKTSVAARVSFLRER